MIRVKIADWYNVVLETTSPEGFPTKFALFDDEIKPLNKLRHRDKS